MTIDQRINARAGLVWNAEQVRHEIVAAVFRHVRRHRQGVAK